ncbi:MAG: glycosyltransferase family 2 protein [Planctomycetota bacterium]
MSTAEPGRRTPPKTAGPLRGPQPPASPRPSRVAADIASARSPVPATISIVLPAYNEVECIGEAIERASEALESGFLDWELIVVDDGSSDGTRAVIEAAETLDPRVRLVAHEQNQGYGAALANGFRASRMDLVGYTDSDLQFDFREFEQLGQRIVDEEVDVVFGFRIYRYDAVLRCLLSWTYNRLVRVLFGVGVRDVDCAFKLFRREAVERLVLESTDFFVDTEMVAESGRLGLRMVEQGVRHYPRYAGSTTVRPSDIPRTLRTVARMWWAIRKRPKQRKA